MSKESSSNPVDLAALRARLAGKRGPQYWRSLDELADTPEFRQWVEDEFPHRSSLLNAATDRRGFIKVMAASMALAGLAGCRFQPQRKIVPYVQAPEDVIPGKPLFYATAVTRGGYAMGVLAESHEGRPTKLEGNRHHPSSLGATDALTQASILQLYDPDRGHTIGHAGMASNWDELLAALRPVVAAERAAGGAGLAVLTDTVTSPTLVDQLRRLKALLPQMRRYAWDPVGRAGEAAAAQALFGRDVQPVYRFDRAAVVLSLDADFLSGMPGSVRYASDWSTLRRVRAERPTMNRLYSVESVPSITGAVADHRAAVRPSQVEVLARRVAAALGAAPADGTADGPAPHWMDAAVRDLQANRGACLVVPGPEQPPALHALAWAMNTALGNVGKTVVAIDPVPDGPADGAASLRDAVADMASGAVKALVILGANPAYSAPGDVDFARALRGLTQAGAFTLHVGRTRDETGELCAWHVPATHELEAWSDARAHDGTVTIIQPLVQPLYEARSPHEVLEAMLGTTRPTREIVRDYWRKQRPAEGFELWWERCLHDGVIPGSAHPTRPVAARAGASLPPAAAPAAEGALELAIRPDASAWAGEFSGNAWMQETPRPLSKLVWDNAATVSPATAEALKVSPQQLVQLQVNGQGPVVEAPILVMPGHPDGVVSVTLGYGRTQAGGVANGVGHNASPLRAADALWSRPGLQVKGTRRSVKLVSTQNHHGTTPPSRDGVDPSSLEHNRELVRYTTLDQFVHGDDDAHDAHGSHGAAGAGEGHHGPAGSLYPDMRGEGYYKDLSWGMLIDNTVCIGCNACVVACQAENNISVVGKDETSRGREMHWLRIDRYYRGGLDNPDVAFLPVPCMHCEDAPCEPVCPVGATLHSTEGLNQMVYNRCVGTRYCSNNCPYKVRRFNFYKYSAGQPANAPGNYDIPIMQLSANPNVTVRGRGVMEKCTYCVQRINVARIEAKKAGREVADGEVVTACQQACPTRAIVFGNLNDPKSAVGALKKQPHHYALLGELNTRPRTTYLGLVRNPNPDVPGAEGE